MGKIVTADDDDHLVQYAFLFMLPILVLISKEDSFPLFNEGNLNSKSDSKEI